MELIEAIKQRRSVRQYMDKKIEANILAELQAEIDACNKEGGLHKIRCHRRTDIR